MHERMQGYFKSTEFNMVDALSVVDGRKAID